MISYYGWSRADSNDLLGCLAGAGGEGISPLSWQGSSFDCDGWPDKIHTMPSVTHHDVPHFILAVTEQGNVWSETSVAVHKISALQGGLFLFCRAREPTGGGRAWQSQNGNHLAPPT